MRRIILTGLLVLLSASAAAQAQTQTPTRPTGDACHVYVVDVKKAEKFMEEFYAKRGQRALPQTAAAAAEAGETVFPQFYTTVAEEKVTSQSYRFPGSKLFILARVFYTDESMPAESMLVGVGLSEKEQTDDLWTENMAVAEVAYNEQTNVVRAKQRVKVEGRIYLVGLECRVARAAAK